MTKRQLDLFPNFSHGEIKRSGGRLAGIDFRAFAKLQNFRFAIGRRVKFQKNGINSGNHNSPEHEAGKAFDIRFDKRDGVVTFAEINRFVKEAIKVGFRGIGIYWNRTEYSLHLDDGSTFDWWSAHKIKVRHGKAYRYKWAYMPFLNNPRG